MDRVAVITVLVRASQFSGYVYIRLNAAREKVPVEKNALKTRKSKGKTWKIRRKSTIAPMISHLISKLKFENRERGPGVGDWLLS